MFVLWSSVCFPPTSDNQYVCVRCVENTNDNQDNQDNQDNTSGACMSHGVLRQLHSNVVYPYKKGRDANGSRLYREAGRMSITSCTLEGAPF